jgi:hypothetical protein
VNERLRSRSLIHRVATLYFGCPPQANERCSRQALFGCGFAAMVIVCLQLDYALGSR